MSIMLVVCSGAPDTRFDRAYYAEHHLALAMECWKPYGLEAAEAFYPAGPIEDWLSIGVYRFKEGSDIDAALVAPETDRIMADVERFTDATVVIRSMFNPA